VRLVGVAQFNAPKHATRIAGAKSRPRPGIVNERVFDRTNFADRIVQTPWRGVEFLRLLPAGGYDRQMLERLRDVIADTADEFDLIVIDDGLSSTESILLGPALFRQRHHGRGKRPYTARPAARRARSAETEAGPSSPAPFWPRSVRGQVT
jgi:hypothetical protein